MGYIIKRMLENAQRLSLKHYNGRLCSSFQLNEDGKIHVGFNFDTMLNNGMFVVNKSGITKTAFCGILESDHDIGKPAAWHSKFGSITINMFGREFPAAGMNEAGLIVNTLGLAKSKYPKPDSRPSISILQLAQYHLDNFATVKEVIESDALYRIRPTKTQGAHLFVCDKEGQYAVIEFINGKQNVYTNKSMPIGVITNDTYLKSINHLKRKRKPLLDLGKSIERFIKVAEMIDNYEPEESKIIPLDFAFEILNQVSWSAERKLGGKKFIMETKCSIVYDVINSRIYFKTFDNQQVRYIELLSFDISNSTPVKVLNMSSKLSGNVSEEFIDYFPKMNYEILKKNLNDVPSPVFIGVSLKLFLFLLRHRFKKLPELPIEILEELSSYPEKSIPQK